MSNRRKRLKKSVKSISHYKSSVRKMQEGGQVSKRTAAHKQKSTAIKNQVSKIRKTSNNMNSRNLPTPNIKAQNRQSPTRNVVSNIKPANNSGRNGCTVSCDVYTANGQLVQTYYNHYFNSLQCSQMNEQQFEGWMTQWSGLPCGGNCFCLSETYNESDGVDVVQHFEPGSGGPSGYQDYPGGTTGNYHGCVVSCDISNLLGQLVTSNLETCFSELHCGETSPQQYSGWVNSWSWLANSGYCGSGVDACYCIQTSFTTQAGCG